jgi:AmiR/NasT family two-component response regulator
MENVETLKIKLITQKSAMEAFESLKNTAMSKYPNVKLVKIGEQTIEEV